MEQKVFIEAWINRIGRYRVHVQGRVGQFTLHVNANADDMEEALSMAAEIAARLKHKLTKGQEVLA